MSYNAASEEIEARRKREALELCGKNRGPHDYIAIEWTHTKTSQRVSRIMCRTCFRHIPMSEVLERYEEIKI